MDGGAMLKPGGGGTRPGVFCGGGKAGLPPPPHRPGQFTWLMLLGKATEQKREGSKEGKGL